MNENKLIILIITAIIVLITTFGCDYSIPELPTPPWEAPPTFPAELNAETISPTEILLTWEDRNSYEIGYEIQESVSNPNNFQIIDSTREDEEVYSIDDRQILTTYYYRVRGFNDFGMSGFSDIVRITMPDYPPNTPGTLQAEAISSTEIQLSWKDNSPNETGFELYESVGSNGNFQLLTITSRNDTTITISNKTALTTYYYRLRAVNDYGYSDYSAIVWATPGSFSPNPPLNLQAMIVSPTEVLLTWVDNADNEEQFEIYESVGNNQNFTIRTTAEANRTDQSLTDLVPNTTYHYRIRAVNQYGSSSFSEDAEVTTPNDVPTAPTNLQAEAISANQIDIEWTDNSDDETGFRIERKIDENGSYNEVSQITEDVIVFQDVGLQPNTTYFYRICAFNENGNSLYSNEVSVTTPNDVPNAPTTLQAEAISANQIDLEWIDNSNDEIGFRIERKTGAEGQYSLIAQVALDDTVHQDIGLEPNTTYFYRICAFNENGNSLYSNEVSVTTQNEFEGFIVYIADGNEGVIIIDASDPENPAEIGSFETERGAMDVTSDGTYAYVTEFSGFEVFDVSEPNDVTSLGFYDGNEHGLHGNAEKLDISEEYAFVAWGGAGLQIFDISTPEQFSHICQFGNGVHDVVVDKSLAYITCYQEGLKILDLSNINRPNEISSFDETNWSTFYVDIKDDIAVISTQNHRQDIYTAMTIVISEPNESVSEISRIDAMIGEIEVSGDYAYVAPFYYGVYIIDISVPSEPIEVSFYDCPNAKDIAVVDNLVYIAVQGSGLTILDVSNPVRPQRIGHFATQGNAYGVGLVKEFQ